jgi:hypothetical protein
LIKDSGEERGNEERGGMLTDEDGGIGMIEGKRSNER